MTADEFRKIALEQPGAAEAGHMNHPDFRVHDRIFATLGYPDDAWGMVNLEPHEQLGLVAAKPKIFRPVKGAWGERGATNVNLDEADVTAVTEAMELGYARICLKPAGKARSKGSSR